MQSVVIRISGNIKELHTIDVEVDFGSFVGRIFMSRISMCRFCMNRIDAQIVEQ